MLARAEEKRLNSTAHGTQTHELRTTYTLIHTKHHKTQVSLKEQFTDFASLAIWPLKFHLSTDCLHNEYE